MGRKSYQQNTKIGGECTNYRLHGRAVTSESSPGWNTNIRKRRWTNINNRPNACNPKADRRSSKMLSLETRIWIGPSRHLYQLLDRYRNTGKPGETNAQECTMGQDQRSGRATERARIPY